MAQIIEDRVKETSTSTGTGIFTLLGAIAGNKAFSSVCANSDTFYYAIQGVDGAGNATAEWEVGQGTWNTGNNLTRNVVFSSSNSNSKVNFSAGNKQVWIDAPAIWIKSALTDEKLSAVSKTLHVGTVIAATIYDTSKDSDGGAWRKRCANTSWFQEAINGVWLGQAATAAAAWALSGAATGAYFQNSTDGKFYVLGASSPTVSETFRGNTREFPAVVEIIAETNRVVIYDATKVDRPMWMVFVNVGMAGYSTTISCIAAVNSQLLIGAANGTTQVYFIGDFADYRQSGNARTQARLTTRNVSALVPKSAPFVMMPVNSIATTVLDTAPIDPVTGLRIPTIAVATGYGVSVIKDDGTVVNSSTTASVSTVAIDPTSVWISNSASGAFMQYANLPVSASWTTTVVSQPYSAWPLGGSNQGVLSISATTKAKGANSGVVLLKPDFTTPSKGMVDYITSAYNSGWMVGDIRGAWLADTTAETVAASGELITNGAFATDTNWNKGTGWSIASEAASCDGTDGTYLSPTTSVNPVAGKTYLVTYTVTAMTSGSVLFTAGGVNGVPRTAVGTYSECFTATSTAPFQFYSGSFLGSIDNVSVKLVEADRSVKNNGLNIVGTLTKSAVASGANLVAYSGFSASNYLEQPYNSQLDFNTGDFCVMGWVNVISNASTQCVFSRGTSGAGFLALYFLSGTWRIMCSATEAVTNTAVAVSTGLQHIILSRVSGNIYLHINGVQVYTAANTANITNTSAKLVVGAYFDYTLAASNCSLALWKISATAPSADQIAYIYGTERKLFEQNAQCTLAGTSNAVTSLAYDDATDILHVGTDWGRSGFQGLVRVDSAATTVGTGMKLAASDGSILTCGTNATIYQPAYFLREELKRKKEAREALGKIPVFFDSDATASQTTFLVPKGYTVKAVYSAGTLKRIGSTKDYTIANDGFKESVVFGTGLSASTWVSIMCIRSAA